jgi:hypothetical protein
VRGRLPLSAGVPQDIHKRQRGQLASSTTGADDSDDHTAFLLCVRAFGAGPWVSAARRGAACRFAARSASSNNCNNRRIRSLSSILRCIGKYEMLSIPQTKLQELRVKFALIRFTRSIVIGPQRKELKKHFPKSSRRNLQSTAGHH